jgi:hypothetical protein
MQADIKTVTKTMKIIDNKEQIESAMKGELIVYGKHLLVTKGNNTGEVVRQIFTRFSKEKDAAGKNFVMSTFRHGICHTDTWNRTARISAAQFEEYLNKFFCYAEKINNSNGDALVLTDKLPKFAVSLYMQGRWMNHELADLFTWVK